MSSSPEPEVQDDDPDLTQAPWKSLFNFTSRKHLLLVSVGAFFAICAGFITPIFAIFLGRVFEEFTDYGAGKITASTLRSKTTTNCVGIVILGIIDWALNTVYYGVFVGAGEMYAARIRGKVFRELLKRDIEWFEGQKEGSGALLSGIQAHINDLQTATSQPLGLIIQYASRSLVSLILALIVSWRLSLVTLAGIPLFSFVIGYLSNLMTSSITAQEAELTHVSKIANNAFASIDTVKYLNGQAFELQNFASRIERSAIHYLRQARLNSLQIAMIRWMMFGMFVQGFWYGSSLARSGNLSSGDVITTFWLCTTAAQSIEQVLPQGIFMEKGKHASAILKRMMGERKGDTTSSEVNGSVTPGICFGNIQVNNVSFAYPSQLETSVLKNASFNFPVGETVFVIGKSGSGKSTLGQLLMRFYLPTTGEILIDGHPLESLDITWIRQNITLLEQRSVLFNDSVGRNISLGRLDSTDLFNYSPYEVFDSIKFAMLHNTVEGLPRGVHTSVGPRGSFLSGGQRQRVAIARAHLRDTPILILDEPTSALDHANRVSIMKSLREWRKGKTTIIITHDMSQIQRNDFAYILEHGVITHSGRRHELEGEPDCAKYFPIEAKSDSDSEKNIQNAKISSTRTSTPGSIRIPKRLQHTRKISFAQHHLPPGFRSTTFEMQTRRHSTDAGRMLEQSDPMAQKRFIHLYPNGSSPDLSSELWDEEEEQGQNIEMVEIETPITESQSRMHYISPERLPSIKKKKEKRFRGSSSAKGINPSLAQIMGTIVPSLTLKQRLILFLGVASALAHAAATPVFSYCLSQLLASFYVTENSANIARKWSLAVLGVSCGDGLSSFFMHYFLEFCAEAWMDTLRINAFEKVLGQPKSWFEQEGHDSFRLASYLDQNGEDMRNLLGRFAGFVIVAVGIMVIAVIWSLIVCWKLTLVTLACGPFIYLITRGFEATNGLWERKCSEASSAMSDIFTETFVEIRTVRSLTLEKYFLTKKKWAEVECKRVGVARAKYTGLMFGLVEPTVMCSTALIFYYGAVLAASEFTVDDVVKVFSLLLFSIGYAAQILSWIPQINTSREIATRLLHLSHLPKFGSHEDRGSLTLSTLTPIELKNVYFRYPSRPDTRVLRNVSITIEHNSCTAIVGRSGSGKSTIASLLLALYKAPESRSDEPTILMGGEDIQHLHVPTLRSQIAIVSQQPTIFPGSIHANISYGIDPQAPTASMDSVRNAAKAAGIDDFIISLPKGYWTVVGDGGIGLSGGQNQRLVIARALLRHPQILILDEATSSLDPEGSELVRQTIQRLVSSRKDLTVIIITHAREMIEIADHVIVLNEGLVVEDGPYDVLSRNIGGKLYELMNYSEDGGG